MKSTLIKLALTGLFLWGAASWLNGVLDRVESGSSAGNARHERLDAAYSGGGVIVPAGRRLVRDGRGGLPDVGHEVELEERRR